MSAAQPTPGPPPSTPPPISEEAVRGALRTALRDMLILLGALTVVGVGVGWLVAGLPGVWGALLGVGLALLFSGATIISVMKTTGAAPGRTATVVMGTWLVKIVVVFIALAVLSRFDFYDRLVLAAVLLAGVIGSAVLDLRAVQRARIPYVEPAAPADGAPTA